MSGDEVCLRHILEAIEAIEAGLRGATRELLEEDRKTWSAVVRELEIIGEAANNLSSGFRDSRPDIPVQEMVGMRNKLIHKYFGVDLGVVWQTVTEDLPILKQSVQKILAG